MTLLVRSNVRTATPTQILGEVLTHDIFKKSQDEAHGGTIEEKKKSMDFKAQDSKIEEESGCQEEESVQKNDEQEELWQERTIIKEKSFC
jgi:hypothetical protein